MAAPVVIAAEVHEFFDRGTLAWEGQAIRDDVQTWRFLMTEYEQVEAGRSETFASVDGGVRPRHRLVRKVRCAFSRH